MSTSSHGNEGVAVAVLHERACTSPTSPDQLLGVPDVPLRVPVEGDDAVVVVAAAEESCVSFVQL